MRFMRTPFNFLVVGVLVAAWFVKGALPDEKQPRSDSPISVIASTRGAFPAFAGGTRSWHLSVNSAGRAHLTIYTFPKRQTREFNVRPEQIDKLAEVLEKEQFFGLKPDYGEQDVADASFDTITIVRGDIARTVRIHYLMNWVYNDPSKLKEPARAVRVFQVVRGWFDDKDAVDLRKYEDMVLKAADKGG
jgi:hypothetical protein